VLALVREHGAKAAPELIVVGAFPGRPSFAGLGELTPPELETLWPTRRPATEAALEEAAAAWAAVRAPEPTALAEVARRDSEELPFLAPALRRLLEEYPAPRDGLSGTERRALQALAAGAESPPAAFVAAQGLENAPFLGDPRSTASSRSSARTTRAWSRAATGRRCPRPRRSRTRASSRGSGCA